MINFLPLYQQNNIKAFWADDDEAMQTNLNVMLGGTSPCHRCKIAPGATTGVGARTGWPYAQLARTEEGEVWMDRLASSIPLAEWEFNLAPSFPEEIPMLFLYSSTMFFDASWLEWLDAN